MRRLLLVGLYLLGASFPSTAHAVPPDLTTLKTPDSPAFVALGVSPTEIQRPTTPKAFATSLVSAFKRDDGSVSIPQGLAIEVAPYWLVPHPELGFDELAASGVESSFYRNLTLSLATSIAPSVAADAGAEPAPTLSMGSTDAAIGLRTTILHPKLSNDQQQCVTDITRELDAGAKVEDKLRQVEMKRLADEAWAADGKGPIPSPPTAGSEVPEPTPPEPPPSNDPDFTTKFNAWRLQYEEYQRQQRARGEYVAAKEHQARWLEYQKLVLSFNEKANANLAAQGREQRLAELNGRLADCMSVINARGEGYSLDVAGSLALGFPGSEFDRGEIDRILGWATLSYASSNLTFLALGRYLGDRDELSDEVRSGFDLGARALYAQDRWGLSFEYVRRKLQDRSVEQRYDGGFDYRVADGTWVTITFGKDFGPGDEGAVIALANLQLNFGEQRLKPLSEMMK